MLGPGLVAIGALPAANALNDRALTCLVGAERRPVRIGDSVRDLDGREIGTASAAQCAPGADRARLRFQPNLYGTDVLEIDARDVEGDVAGRGVRLALSADQLKACSLLSSRPEPTEPGITRGPSLERQPAPRRGQEPRPSWRRLRARRNGPSGPPHLQLSPSHEDCSGHSAV
jgi:hypothetical protein